MNFGNVDESGNRDDIKLLSKKKRSESKPATKKTYNLLSEGPRVARKAAHSL